MKNITKSEENYLKSIYQLGIQGHNSVSTNAIAEYMETKASSVTDMIKKFSEKKLVHYIKYKGVSLTKKGQKIAAMVIRKHRLWEVFLVKKLNFSWDEVHDVAEQLEHIQSDKLVDALDQYLGCPTIDPHGEPIPDKNGIIQETDKILLSQATENSEVICVGVNDDSSNFLKYLDKNKIKLGTELKIISKESYDQSVSIKIKNRIINISELISNNLFVKIKTT